MKKFGIFWVFAFFFSMMSFFVVDDNEAGGDDGEIDDDIGDFDIDDDELDDGDEKTDKKQKEPPSDDESKKQDDDKDEIKKRLEEIEKQQQEIAAQRELLRVESELSKKYDGFSLEKIHQKLVEMEEKNPGSGEQYNNPLGFELIWLKEFAKNKKDVDGFDMGREEKSEPFDVDKAYEAIRKGDKKARLALLENSK